MRALVGALLQSALPSQLSQLPTWGSCSLLLRDRKFPLPQARGNGRGTCTPAWCLCHHGFGVSPGAGAQLLHLPCRHTLASVCLSYFSWSLPAQPHRPDGIESLNAHTVTKLGSVSTAQNPGPSTDNTSPQPQRVICSEHGLLPAARQGQVNTMLKPCRPTCAAVFLFISSNGSLCYGRAQNRPSASLVSFTTSRPGLSLESYTPGSRMEFV